MSDREYSAEELAREYQISRQQALRHIARFGADRAELDHFLSSASRTPVHRAEEVNRTASDIAFG